MYWHIKEKFFEKINGRIVGILDINLNKKQLTKITNKIELIKVTAPSYK